MPTDKPVSHQQSLTETVLEGGRRLVQLHELASQAARSTGMRHVVGASGSAPALLIHSIVASSQRRVVHVVPESRWAGRAVSDLAALASGLPLHGKLGIPTSPERILSLPTQDASPFAQIHSDRQVMARRAATLGRLALDDWQVLVVSAAALVRKTVPRRVLVNAQRRLQSGDSVEVGELSQRLSEWGYARAAVVEDPGTFAIRGGLVDMWIPLSERPVRLELDGDRIDRMREFDPVDQRTSGSLSELRILPANEAILSQEHAQRARTAVRALGDAMNWPSTRVNALVEDIAEGRRYFGAEGFLPAYYELEPVFDQVGDAVFVVERPTEVRIEIERELERAHADHERLKDEPHFELSELYLTEAEVAHGFGERSSLVLAASGVAGRAEGETLSELDSFDADSPTLAIEDQAELQRELARARKQQADSGALAPLVARLSEWHAHGFAVVICAHSQRQAERLQTLLSHRELVSEIVELPAAVKEARAVRICVASLARGAILEAERIVLLSEDEIFGERSHRQRPRSKPSRAFVEDLRALAPGDFVVHVDHGVGRYVGLERKAVGAVHLDLLVVEYGGGDRLLLPVYRLNQIQKYSGQGGAPRLDRLGGQSFAKTKRNVRKRLRRLADDLLKLYAERASSRREPLPPPDDSFMAFEAAFPFEETRDQAAAIADVMSDFESDKLMDRLVCGDVGFGKTEVALRAAFRHVVAGRQVALLCPTTVLAQQHYLTFAQRFADQAIQVRVMSRFQSKSEQTATLAGLRKGQVDIVVGTHRLLSKDVHFKRLGMLIVDEEQRFGVAHKERIKALCRGVDVMALSATPIPRTLQLAVGGVRDLSVIATPPVDRRSIRTIVSRFDEAVVRDAVEHELKRGGQVFYVYNRIEGLYERAERVQALVPEARVVVAHGQMREASLEKTMLGFVRGEAQVLVSTAIIESGLDIPRANTMIVDRADMFGLSQLYQLRGRVGRSSERAYCYLVVPDPATLTDEARHRIEALERYTELGAGLQVATLDMELRGAGDLLGAEQSGFVASVGLELFCKMLEEVTHELQGEVRIEDVDPELSFDVEALLPDDYIDDVGMRLSFYKQLASADSASNVDDVAQEMEDRFGAMPLEARQLIELMRLKTELRHLRALGCEANAKTVRFHLREDTPLDPSQLAAQVAKPGSQYRLSPDGRVIRSAREGEHFVHGLAHAAKALDELAEYHRST